MEGLMNNVRNYVVSHQSFMLKTAKSKRKGLLERIRILHRDPVQNFDEISELELFLNNAAERELRHELEKLSGFEAVNSEKITPYFLGLAKSSKSEAKMSDIKNTDGSPFNSCDEMKNYVRSYYATLYKKDANEPVNFDNCIENFLGETICNHPITAGRKIPLDLAARLDLPFSIEELDTSISQGNKSACGMDGLSNCFIKKYWHFFRTPLHNYFATVLEKKELTPTFRTGLIKLIPKKGDPSKLTNWRPISLLSCMYKILSRALNNRLKLACDFIYSRAQKGFTSNRYIQEVLINLCETIGYCNEHDIPACIVAIDQSKAFDSISHRYMIEAYKFFGMGNAFINVLTTLGSGRNACISFDDGSISPPFDLERGRTQGNGPSPCEYNIGQQILLLKIELCPEIASVYNHLQVPRTVLGTYRVPHPSINEAIEFENNPRFGAESNCATDKAEGFADDTSVATLFEHDSLLALKNVLVHFASFSGLRCNMEKTAILQIGRIIPVPDQVRDLGFTLCTETKVLGMNISADPALWMGNFENILINIRKKITFWDRFSLSLPGRICVIKSLLISPLSHLGSFFMPSKPLLNNIQKALDNFAKGKLNVSVSKITISVEAGGLGLFNVEEFLMSQQCCWVFRAKKSCRDNWRNDIFELSFGNPLALSPKIINVNRHPILHSIACSFERLRIKFDKRNENYLTSTIFYNPMIFRETRDKRPLCPAYLDIANNTLLTYRFATCQLQNLCGEFGILSYAELYRAGFHLSPLGYGRLSNALNCFFDRLRPDRDDDINEEAKSLFSEFCLIKKPGRKCRRLLSSGRNDDISQQTTCKTFFRLLNTEYIGNKAFSVAISWWNFNRLPNRVRMFAFKFFNNILGLNTRTFHFATNPTRVCQFCHLANILNPPDENFIHLFLQCPTVRGWHDNFIHKYFNSLIMSPEERTKFFYLGIPPNSNEPNFAILSVVLLLQYCIWEEKLRKRKPSFRTLDVLFCDILTPAVKNSQIFINAAAGLPFAIFRPVQVPYGAAP
jgi:hypothetical protein